MDIRVEISVDIRVDISGLYHLPAYKLVYPSPLYFIYMVDKQLADTFGLIGFTLLACFLFNLSGSLISHFYSP